MADMTNEPAKELPTASCFMSQTTRDQHLEAHLANLACPQCKYSLQGLNGSIVTCPECGFNVDVAKAVTSRWSKPWHRAPGLNILILPLAWLVCGAMGVFILLGIELGALGRSWPFVSIVAATLIVIVWILWLYLMRRRLENGLAVPLCLLGHAIFVGYLLGIGLLIVGPVRAYMALQFGLAAAAIPAILTLIGAAIIVLGRHGEKFIAAHCIRQHLIDRTKADTMRS